MVVIVLVIMPVIAGVAVMTMMIITPGDRACAGAVLSRRFLSGSCNPG
jgi:hypothetical protein